MAKKKQNRVKPRLLKGFRDYSPSEQIAREDMLSKIRKAVELMGYLPLQTASLEYAEALLGSHYNEESLAELFGFQGPEDTDMALRYEFTLSLARYVASQPNLPLPFRRYQYGNIWRVDKPGPGRFREFMQFDIDIVGTKNLLADAEIIAAMVRIFEGLGIEKFQVRYSNRKILNGLIEWAGIPTERGPDVMRVLDKLERTGEASVILELGDGRVDDSGDKIAGLSLSAEQISMIREFIVGALLFFEDKEEKHPLDWAEQLLKGFDEAEEGIAQLREVEGYLRSMNISRNKTRIDLTIVRGLGYYTGTVFETFLTDLPDYGSVFSGGRYDNLIDRFSSQPKPAVGSSIGVDRLLAALIKLGAVEPQGATSQVLVTVMDRERLSDYLEMLEQLRSEGIRSEIYTGDTKNITRQIKYADKVGIPFAIIAGSDEFESGQVTIKNLLAGREKAGKTADRGEWLKAEGIQETIPKDKLVDYLRERLDK